MFRRRWPLASKMLMALAVVLGALAFVVVRGYQDRVEASHPAVGPPVDIVTAATDLARGTALSDEMLHTSTVPEDFVPPGAVRDAATVVGRVLTAEIEAGEILTRSRLAGTSVGPVAALVPAGLRAVVVPSGTPAGTIRAGDRVEVYATYGGGRPHTELVASGLEVVRVLVGDTRCERGGRHVHGRSGRRTRAPRRWRHGLAPRLRADVRPAAGRDPRADACAGRLTPEEHIPGLCFVRGRPVACRDLPPERISLDRPAGDHPRPDARHHGVRTHLELRPPHPGAVALQLVDRERPCAQQDVRCRAARGNAGRCGRVLPERSLALPEGVVPLHPLPRDEHAR